MLQLLSSTVSLLVAADYLLSLISDFTICFKYTETYKIGRPRPLKRDCYCYDYNIQNRKENGTILGFNNEQ